MIASHFVRAEVKHLLVRESCTPLDYGRQAVTNAVLDARYLNHQWHDDDRVLGVLGG